MDEVYVLIKQSHSNGAFNYFIMGVFSTEEKAAQHRDKLINQFKKYSGGHTFIIERHDFNSREV